MVEPASQSGLIFEEKTVSSGYGPRSILVSTSHDMLYVGCKDGSVTALDPTARGNGGTLGLGDFEDRLLNGAKRLESGVRALCELDDSHLLAGLANGHLAVLPVRGEAGTEAWPLRGDDDGPDVGPVRAIGRLDEHRAVVSCREAGFLVTRTEGGWTAQDISGYPAHVRFVQPLQRGSTGGGEKLWVLVSDRGDVYLWNGDPEAFPAAPEEVWRDLDRPWIVNDYALLRNDQDRRSGHGGDGLFLATEAGVYLLRLAGIDSGEVRLDCERMALPGLGTMPTALSFAEVARGADHDRYLWVADARGDSHLFEQPGVTRGSSQLHFRRSGVRHSFRETLLCFLWVPEGAPSHLFCGQARRNDQIVLGRYWKAGTDPEPAAELSLHVAIRRLLSHGRWEDQPAGSAAPEPGTEEHWTGVLLGVLGALEHGPGEHGPEERWTERCDASWPPEALLAELFERLGEQDDMRVLLIDSIRSPQAKVVSSLLEAGILNPTGMRMLTQSLLGIIHRSKGDRQLAHLGLLLWLRNRQDELLALDAAERYEKIVSSLYKDIGFARKWGLHGAANAQRRDLVGPIRTLYRQGADEDKEDKKNKKDSPLALDHLTYQTLLFNRRVSQIERYTCDQMRGRTAWSVCLRSFGETSVFAVSWMWGGVELFRLHPQPVGTPPSRFQPLVRFPPPRLGTDAAVPDPKEATGPSPCGWQEGGFEREKHGYSRVVYLGQESSGRWFLLWSPTSPPGEVGPQGLREEILLWPLKEWLPTDDGPSQIPLDAGQSVYSVLELKRGYLVLGLRGRQGNPLLKLLRVELSAERLVGEVVGEWSPVDHGEPTRNTGEDGGPSTRRNRVWSLARDPRRKDGPFWVVIGCEGGQVYRLAVRPERNEPFATSWDESSTQSHLVDRLSSPVRSLLCREGGAGEPSRIYAGGEDGTIIAWQQSDAEHRIYASLWATQEQGPVSSLHEMNFVDGPSTGAEGRDRSMILAITRQGRAVLLDARPKPAAPSDEDEGPGRVPVPGSRFGRYGFPGGIWASSLLGSQLYDDEIAEHTGAFSTVLTAAGDGTLSVSSLHSPSKSEIRKLRYRNILEKARRRVDRQTDCRLGEAVFGAVPSLSWILVRWLLDPTFSDCFDEESPYPDPASVAAWWLPRQLRPLMAVRRAWDDVEGELPAAGDVAESARTVGAALAAALERAWHLDDLHLYQEICSLALKRANFTLFKSFDAKQTLDPSGWHAYKSRVARLYEEVYRAIETSLPSWLGASERREARARAVVAKHIVDGDTIWRVANEAAHEAASRWPEGSPPTAGSPAADDDTTPYLKVLQMRVSGVRELVHKRDPMVSLEALRAANLSLTRLCLRLVQERGGDDRAKEEYRPSPDGGPCRQEVHWPVFVEYFERLTAAAARTFHARLELNDAIAHEYSRTFALVVCACPSATIRIANRLTETLLIRDLESEDDLSRRVLRQLDLLADVGIPCPSWARKLFLHVTSMPQADARLNPTSEKALDRIGLKRPDEPEDVDVIRQIGVQNTEDLYHQAALYDVIDWFVDLTGRLSRDARGIALSTAAVEKQLSKLEKYKYAGRDTYRDSRSFWKECAEDLRDKLQKVETEGDRQEAEVETEVDNLRPEVVLWSRTVGAWAAAVIESKLKQLQRDGQLFLPELSIFRKVLEELRDAANGFREGAAVQKNLVGGILGHHLLEHLDEYILEIEEIAQALDPIGVRTLRQASSPTGASEPRTPTAARFARYLVRRAQGAQSVPKNLRVLQTLLTTDLPPGGKADADLGWLLDHHGWGDDRPTRWIEIKQAELVTLGLTLEELAQNHVKHSGLAQRRPVVEKLGDRSAGIRLTFDFRCHDRYEYNLDRLTTLAETGLQAPCPPREDRDIGSTGSGLYLANMAAAVVGWTLSIASVEKTSDPERAACTFHLQRHAGERTS